MADLCQTVQHGQAIQVAQESGKHSIGSTKMLRPRARDLEGSGSSQPCEKHPHRRVAGSVFVTAELHAESCKDI